jgi:hypothetical protein
VISIDSANGNIVYFVRDKSAAAQGDFDVIVTAYLMTSSEFLSTNFRFKVKVRDSSESLDCSTVLKCAQVFDSAVVTPSTINDRVLL